jgi:hypothetical protein
MYLRQKKKSEEVMKERNKEEQINERNIEF